jgi:tetratricopeptide (TPR) repeat protein
MSEQEHHEQEFSVKNYFVPLTKFKAVNWIVIIGLVVFCNGLFNGFVGDDSSQIVDNPIIHSISNLPLLFSGSTFYNGQQQQLTGAYYKPLLPVFYTLVYAIFGANAFIFHLFEILFFIANACLLYLVFNHFFKSSLAFLFAIIFLVHPINSEIAFYIADAQEILFFFFGILAFLIILNRQTQKAYITTSLLLLCSLLSKETGILFLCISLLYTFIFKRKYFLILSWDVLASFGIYLVLRVHAGALYTNAMSAPIESINFFTRLINVPEIFLFYIKTFLFPITLSSSYQWVYYSIDFIHFFVPLLLDLGILSAIIIPMIFIHQKFFNKQLLVYLFFTCWFILGMLINMQFIPLDATVADRWFYFPFVGVLGMIGVLLNLVHFNFKNKWLLIIPVLIVILFSLWTFVRSFDWRSNYALDIHDLQVTPQNFELENELSYVYINNGDYEVAKQLAEKSVQYYPYFTNYLNLGDAYYHMGDYKDAKYSFLKSLQYGKVYLTYENLAILGIIYGNPYNNINYIKNTSLKNFPQDPTLWLSLAVLEYKVGKIHSAKSYIQQAYNLDPSSNLYYFYSKIMNSQPLKITVGNSIVTIK